MRGRGQAPLTLLLVAAGWAGGCITGSARGGATGAPADPGAEASAGPQASLVREAGAPSTSEELSAGSIEADLVLVDDVALTAAEVLYPLRERIEGLPRGSTSREVEQLQQWVRSQVQSDVGTLLIYREAVSRLSEPQREALQKAVDRRLRERIALEFGGSRARLERHLRDYGLTLTQYRARLEREEVARSYARETLLPQVVIRRSELLDYYRRHIDRYSTPETRELYMIEIPFESCLPQNLGGRDAGGADRTAARALARERIEQAFAALATQPFEEVARQYSQGVHARQGGYWGPIGKPLQPPYDEATRALFTFAEGQYSRPIETPIGWCIVRCGAIHAAQRRSFDDVQQEIHETLRQERLNRLSAEYLARLARQSNISPVEGLVRAAVRQVLDGRWPAGSTGAVRSLRP